MKGFDSNTLEGEIEAMMKTTVMDSNFTAKSIKRIKEILLAEMTLIIHECVQKSLTRNPKSMFLHSNDVLCVADRKH